jgi:outer membrane receptor for ferrienterochelin and colicins
MRTTGLLHIIGLIMMLLVQLDAQQSSIQGTVVDENDQPLVGANVFLQGTVLGAATDQNGNYIIANVPAGTFILVFNIIGYRQEKRNIQVATGMKAEAGVTRLSIAPISGEMIVITASKYEQKIQDVPVSLSVLNRQDILARNTITLDKALQYIPGINLNSSEINIRGASGYSKGVGSRVLFLIDGIPMMTGDTREISYDVIPTYLIERVEVLKGAGSALYGSSALGGVVNFITQDIDQAPHYYLKFYGGLYSKTRYQQWNWSDKSRYLGGSSVSFSRKFGTVGLQLGGAYDGDDSYRQNDLRNRYSGSGKVQWSISPYQQLTVSGNYMYQHRQNFLYWKDFQHALQPPEDQLGDEVTSHRYYLSSHYKFLLGKNQVLTLRGIWFWNRFRDTVAAGNGNQSTAKNINGEVQYDSRLGKVSLTTGIEATSNSAESNMFGTHSGYTAAGYLQTEFPILTNLRTTLGVRLDYFNIDSLESELQLNPKIGVVYALTSSSTLRTSAGRGFRAPSLAEIFTSTIASGFQVIPNPDLKPEKSISFELGFNQKYHNRLSFDVAYFYSHFNDLIEGEFLESGQVQFQNITRARVQGLEILINGQLHPHYLDFALGYTYTDPIDLDTKEFLKFRPRHIFYLNGSSKISQFQFQLDYRFIKKYDRIDEKFSALIKDADQRVDAHIIDARIASNFLLSGFPLRISFQINNLLRYYYVDLVGSLAPLRTFVITAETGF